MTLLICIFAAVISTVVWYKQLPNSDSKVSILCFMFWGASIMWFVDAVVEYIELGSAYFTPSLDDMINDAFLGLSVVALALVIWVVVVLIKDPKGLVKQILFKK